MKNQIIYPFLKGVVLATLFVFSVQAQVQTPADTESALLVDAINQNAGSFDQVDLSYIHSLGMQQKAWNNPMEHLGEGQTKPGYSKYNWTPDTVLPIRLREGMMTLINLPAWELIEKVHIGSPESFNGEIVAPNSLLVYADPSYIGVDSNMIIFGRSGNRYVFYLRSETFNTEKITQSVVDILVGPRWTPAADGGQMVDSNGASSMAAVSNTVLGTGKGAGAQPALATASSGPNDWLKTIPMDPESIRFDLDMFLPNPDDVDIAPDNIWRDNIFTYIDLGPKALTMTQRPIVNLLVQDTEVPVGYRTRGPNSRLIVVEAVGDLVLRNGRKLICIKLRRDPAAGLEYTDYSGSVANTQTVGGMPTNPGIKNMYQSSDALMAGGGAVLYDSVEPVAENYGVSVSTDFVHNPYAENASPYCYDETGAGRCGDVNMWKSLPALPNEVRQTPQMKQALQAVSGPARGEVVPMTGKESIALEFGTSSQISELESLWNKIYAKNRDILSGYEPYYSVDATADGDVMEAFRLRVGTLKDISSADALCRKIGKRGFSCSVVRIQ